MNIKKLILPIRSSIYGLAISHKIQLDFSVIGFPKCATTSIHKTLEGIPGLYMPSHEVQVKNIMDGKQTWPESNYNLCGIKNPNLVYETHNLLALYKSNRNMKFIISIRNPSDWLFSFYQYRMLEIRENKGWLQPQLKKHPEYRKISFDDVVYSNKSFLGVSIQHGFFVNYLKDIFNWIPSENILIVLTEEIATDPCNAYTRIFKFLDVQHDKKNSAGVVANNKKKFYDRRENYTKQLSFLDNVYRQKNHELNTFLKEQIGYNNIYW